MATNEELYRRTIDEGYVQGNVDMLDEVCAEGYVNHDALAGDLDVEGEKETIRGIREGMPDMRVEVLDLFSQGDLVCCRWRATGTHSGMFFGFQPTGETITIEGIDLARVQDGKIQELWSKYDTFGLLRQVRAATGAGEEPRPSA